MRLPLATFVNMLTVVIGSLIGLALHQHFTAQRLALGLGASAGQSGSVSWASSGRIEIMNARQRVTSRGKQIR